MFVDSEPEKGIFTLNEVPQMIKYLREERGLSLIEFGEPFGFRASMVDTENGSRKMGVSSLMKIASAYKLKMTIHIEKEND